jgi:DNA-binding LacI/PurR family transcriptional regulator
MAVTIRDVARHADVSIATVSRALSAPDLVAERTRARVIAVARQLGYEPNRAARSLITGRTGFIGAVVPDMANPFFLGVLKGIQAGARERGMHVLLADTAEDAATEAELLRSIGRQVDGLVLLSSRLSVPQLREFSGAGRAAGQLSTVPVNTVLFNRVLPGFPTVLLDSGDGIRQIVGHLTALGHRRCAYAGGPRESFADAERRRGFAKACQNTGLRVVDLGSFPPVFAAGARVADLALEAGVTAVIAFNDLVALGILARLRDRRVDVPLEISVVGFDDIPMASMCAPRLTTVSLPLEQAGRTLLELLLHQQVDGGGVGNPSGAARGRLLPVRLVVRSSTAPVRRIRS